VRRGDRPARHPRLRRPPARCLPCPRSCLRPPCPVRPRSTGRRPGGQAAHRDPPGRLRARRARQALVRRLKLWLGSHRFPLARATRGGSGQRFALGILRCRLDGGQQGLLGQAAAAEHAFDALDAAHAHAQVGFHVVQHGGERVVERVEHRCQLGAEHPRERHPEFLELIVEVGDALLDFLDATAHGLDIAGGPGALAFRAADALREGRRAVRELSGSPLFSLAQLTAQELHLALKARDPFPGFSRERSLPGANHLERDEDRDGGNRAVEGHQQNPVPGCVHLNEGFPRAHSPDSSHTQVGSARCGGGRRWTPPHATVTNIGQAGTPVQPWRRNRAGLRTGRSRRPSQAVS